MMAAAMTLYQVLGLTPDASTDDIRRAYLAAAKRHHPDAGADDDRAMQAVNAAWAVLGQPARRRAYDAEMRWAASNRVGGGDATSPAPPFASAASAAVWLPDRPPRRATSAGDHLVLMPVALLALALAAFAMSMVASSSALWAAAVVLLPVAGASFLAMPLLVMRRQRRIERRT